MRPILTIITVNMNNAEGLQKTLDSVAGQTYTNYEHLIIDGGSTDGSVEVIKEYAKKFNGVAKGLYWVSEPDKGIYNAMNKGILKSTGKYIYLLNSGDIIFSNAISLVFSQNKQTAQFIYGNVKRMPSGVIYDGPFDLAKLFNNNICQQAILYHRHLFQQLGLFNTNYKSRADYAFNIQVFSQKHKTEYVPVTISQYDDNGFSSTYFDINFWADYKQNWIQPFCTVKSKKELYSKLWSYYFQLLNQKEYIKAIRLFLTITLREKNIRNSCKSLKYFCSKLRHIS